MDVERLQIDRSKVTRRAKRRGGGWGLLFFVALVAAALWFFRAPLMRLADRVRLQEVEVVVARKANPVAASAVSGTAANGYVVARTRAALSADTPGRIVEMNVEEGSVVKEGDVVARLFSDEFAAALALAEAEVLATESFGKRATAEVESARVTVEARRAEVEASQARLKETEAREALAIKNLARARKLLEGRVSSQQNVDDALAEHDRAIASREASAAQVVVARGQLSMSEAQYTVAQAAEAEAGARVAVARSARDQAAATLDKTFVRAPFDGIVVLKDAEIGEVVSPNSQGGNSRGSVCTMVDFESLEVQVDLPETSLGSVRIDGSANVYLDAFPSKRYAGRVSRIWPTADRQKATVEVRVVFQEPDADLRPEMGARIVFVEEADEAGAEPSDDELGIILPASAVVNQDGGSGVYVLERDTVRFQTVQLGDSRGSRIFVEEGLEGGERVVLDPPPGLSAGDRVRVRS